MYSKRLGNKSELRKRVICLGPEELRKSCLAWHSAVSLTTRCNPPESHKFSNPL